MISQEGLNYVKQQLDVGASPQALKQAMVAAGWQAVDVDELISTIVTQKTQAVLPAVAADKITDTTTISAKPIKKSISSKGVIIISVLFLIFAGMTAAYFFIFSPQKVFASLPTKIQKIKTSSYVFDLKGNLSMSGFLPGAASGSSNSSGGTKFSLSGSGQSDTKSATSVTNATKLSANFSTNGAPDQVAEVEVRLIENNLYLKVDKLPEFGIVTDGFLGQWVKADSTNITQSGGEQIQKEIAPEQLAKVQAVYSRNVFLLIKNPKFERWNGDFVYHYEFSIDKEKLKSFINDYNKSVLLKPVSDAEMTVYDGTIANLPDITGHIWIGILDSYLRKITFSSALTNDSIVPVGGNIDFSLILSSINKSVSIETPTNTKNMTDVISGVTSSLNPLKDTDNDGLTDADELIWKTDKNNPDTDGDSYTDGYKEICSGYNPLGPGMLTDEQKILPKLTTCTPVTN
jgi:hypothetical protein